MLEEEAEVVGHGRRARRAGAPAPIGPRRADASPAAAGRAVADRRAGRSSERRPTWRARWRATSAPPRRRTGRRAAHRSCPAPTATTVPRSDVVVVVRDPVSRHGSLSFVIVTRSSSTAWSSSVTFWMHADRHAGFGRGILDALQEVADDLVAVGADADLRCRLATSRDDHAGAGVGLARTRRALDGERAVIDRLDEAARGIESGLAGLLAAGRPATWPTDGGRRRSTSRAARHGPGASMPCSATHSPRRSSAARCSLSP